MNHSLFLQHADKTILITNMMRVIVIVTGVKHFSISQFQEEWLKLGNFVPFLLSKNFCYLIFLKPSYPVIVALISHAVTAFCIFRACFFPHSALRFHIIESEKHQIILILSTSSNIDYIIFANFSFYTRIKCLLTR